MWIAIQNAVGQGVGGGPGPTPPPYTPPLDLYPADIAYSVRKLSSSYSGPCMEVERIVDAATLDIGFDSNGLLDTQAIIDFLVAGGGVQEARVRTWYDQTGNSRHAQQTIGSEMSYIYGGGSIREVNGKPVVDPIYGGDGLYYIQGTYSTASNNTIFTVISPGLTGGSYVMSRYSGAFTQGILGAGIEEPISGWNSGIDFGFGTTQYYRDGAFYGSGTTLQRNDIMQSVLASRRIMGIGFTQSGLTEPLLRLGRDTSSSIYATQEYIVYFSDQLGTVPRTALEGNINSYYQVANLPDYTSGFLADYPDAAAAYSVRQLSNTAIKCMRVRRAVAPFDEKDIGFTAGGDLDEAAIVAFGGSDVLLVSAWYDQSGQSNHATQITPNSQPEIYDGSAVITENGKPAIRNIGQAQYMEFSGISINAAGGYTSFAAKGTQTDWGSPVTAGAFIRSVTSFRVYGNNQNLFSFGSPNNFDRYLLTARKDNRDYDVYKGTTNIDSRTLTIDAGNTFSEILKGASFDPNSVPDNCFLHEVIIYDSAKSYTDVTAIQNNIITEFY